MNLLRRLVKHELVSGSFYIFIGSTFGNLLAFLLNLFLARNLSYADYAIYASLISIINLLSIPANSLATVVVKFATPFFVKKDFGKLKSLYIIFIKFVLGLSFSIVLAMLIFSPILSSFLKLDNYFFIILTAFTVASFYLQNLNTAFLQSLLKFGLLGAILSIGSMLKILIGIGLVILGFRAFGGIWAVFAMTIGIFLISYFPLIEILRVKSTSLVTINKKEVFSFAVPAFLTLIAMTSFTSTDVILVKHFFSSQQAGLYAGLSLIGKVIFYFTFPIPVVMFPLLIKRHAVGTNYLKLFILALLLVVVPSIVITLFYFVRPEFVINFFLGGRDYLLISKYLGIYGIFLTIFSVVNVFVNFFLSLNKTKIVFPVVAIAVLQIILISIYHSDFYQVILVSTINSLFLLVFLTALFIKDSLS